MIVKQLKRGRPKGSGNKLSAQSILDIAKVLMKEEKKIPSIRKLASSLDVDPMAIYHYFENKNDLLEAITISLIEDIYYPQIQIHPEAQINDDWKIELTKLCVSYLTLLDNYPGLLTTLLSMSSISPAQVFAERFNIVIKGLNLDQQAADNALSLLADYLHGYAQALNCKNSDSPLNVGMLKGPLSLYCLALENIE